MASGAVMGGISGVIIAKLKIPPFIATLGMMQIARGLALVFSEAKPIYFNDTPSFQLISAQSSISLLIPGLDIPNGAFVMSVLTNGLRVMGVQEEWKIVVTGIIIIVAVLVDLMLRKRMLPRIQPRGADRRHAAAALRGTIIQRE